MSIKRYEFVLPNVYCPGCVEPIEEAIKSGTKLAIKAICINIDDDDKIITIDVENPDKTAEEIKQLLTASIRGAAVDFEEKESHWIKGIFGVLCGISLLALSLAGIVLPPLAMVGIAGLSTLFSFFLGFSTYKRAFREWFALQPPTMNTLFTISSLIAIGVSIAAFFIPWLPMMFDAPLLIFGFRHIGQAIETHMRKGMDMGVKFRHRAPQEVEVFEDVWKKKNIKDILPGAIIRVKRGETIR